MVLSIRTMKVIVRRAAELVSMGANGKKSSHVEFSGKALEKNQQVEKKKMIGALKKIFHHYFIV